MPGSQGCATSRKASVALVLVALVGALPLCAGCSSDDRCACVYDDSDGYSTLVGLCPLDQGGDDLRALLDALPDASLLGLESPGVQAGPTESFSAKYSGGDQRCLDFTAGLVGAVRDAVDILADAFVAVPGGQFCVQEDGSYLFARLAGTKREYRMELSVGPGGSVDFELKVQDVDYFEDWGSGTIDAGSSAMDGSGALRLPIYYYEDTAFNEESGRRLAAYGMLSYSGQAVGPRTYHLETSLEDSYDLSACLSYVFDLELSAVSSGQLHFTPSCLYDSECSAIDLEMDYLSRWLSDGTGRCDGASPEGAMVAISTQQCWSSGLEEIYFQEAREGEVTELIGDESLCGLP